MIIKRKCSLNTLLILILFLSIFLKNCLFIIFIMKDPNVSYSYQAYLVVAHEYARELKKEDLEQNSAKFEKLFHRYCPEGKIKFEQSLNNAIGYDISKELDPIWVSEYISEDKLLAKARALYRKQKLPAPARLINPQFVVFFYAYVKSFNELSDKEID